MPENAQPGRTALLRQAVRGQIALVTKPPFETLITVAVNGALMSSAWFFLPTNLKDKLFDLHGTLAFALVLAAWMYSDVPATNVLGPDAERAIAAIDDPTGFRRLLLAKHVVLWGIVTPVCAVLALVIGLLNHDLLAAVFTIVWIAIVPFGALGLSALVGVLFPYHPMPLKYRWQNRQPKRRMLLRWGILVVTPYGVVPFLAVVLMVPSLLVWGVTFSHGLAHKLPDRNFGWGILLAAAISIVCCVGGHRLATVITKRRRERLVTFLADAGRG
jgi:hypothetical protein